VTPLVGTSEALHTRVRRFALGKDEEGFEELALDIARFQAEASPRFAALVERRGSRLDTVESVPAVPAEAFRLSRVAVHPPALDRARFLTSGTTVGGATSGAARGVHYFRTTATYELVALRHGARALTGERTEPRVVVSLAPVPDEPSSSSLAFMMALFQRRWDGRALDAGAFVPRAEERWLARHGGVDLRALERAASVARSRGEPLLLLSTAFALVALLDVLGGRRIVAPERTVVMVTGGFKGRSRKVDRAELRGSVARAFGVPEENVVAQYGMTELSSQLYEGTAAESTLGGEPDVLLEPAWLRVVPVAPVTLDPVPAGEIGVARIVDLANVDSALVVQTEDLVRRRPGGIELLGRRPGAAARGCSLAMEALLS
jgi:hypothetical protein